VNQYADPAAEQMRACSVNDLKSANNKNKRCVLMRTHVGRGAGAFIEPRLFTAEKFAWVCSPWISPSFAQRMVDLAKKGVEVRIITSEVEENKEMLKILKESVKPPKDFLGRVKKDWVRPSIDYLILRSEVDQPLVHAKIYVVDGEYAVTGSANCTESGFYHNIEHIIIFDSPEEVERIEEDFAVLWKLYMELGETAVKEYTEPMPSKLLGALLSKISRK